MHENGKDINYELTLDEGLKKNCLCYSIKNLKMFVATTCTKK